MKHYIHKDFERYVKNTMDTNRTLDIGHSKHKLNSGSNALDVYITARNIQSCHWVTARNIQSCDWVL